MLKALKKRKNNLDINETLAKIKSGFENHRNELIHNHKPFILKEISKVCKRFIREEDEEFSIGLLAFNEAIDNFDCDKGSSFYSLARMIIRNRIIDYIRKESKHNTNLSFDLTIENEEGFENLSEIKVSTIQHIKDEESNIRKEEILDYTLKLKEFGISFQDLVDISPKHKDARFNIIKISKILHDNVEIRESILNSKRLPIKDILKLVDCSKKTIERNRKYLIAIFIIIDGDYVFLKEYLMGVNA